ncbi:Hypothetical predicted protein [Lecanosticta acicola]|uniref:Uncharacterized protein n=1 Tax=Lecanosticta acicola TaxID=111012 RepID=A0AAI8Z859_9PEZI|nr:Hypothetical predicted protein [Lecanosticta acicola]
MAASHSVYTGFWINWSQGSIGGATLTLSSQHGAYLVAFLALFVQLAGVYSWQILSYIFFNLKTSPQRTDDLTQQHLAILRNVASDFGTLWELVKASWKARHSHPRPYRRILYILASAFLHGLGFTIAGIISSRVTTTTSEALLRSNICGTWHTPPYDRNQTDQSLEDALWEDKWDTVLRESSNFAARCYNTTAPSSNCNAYGRRIIPFATSTHSGCPFDPSMCVNDTVVRLDSGYVDSLQHLGINSPPSGRVGFRKVVECAPIKTEGYRRTFDAQNLTQDAIDLISEIDSVQGHSFEAFYYGRSLAWDTEATYVLSNNSFETSAGSFFVPYRMHAETAVPYRLGADSVFTSFIPIPELNRTDAEVVLLFLANKAFYTSPVADPWFDARVPIGLNISVGKGYDFDMYSPRQSVAVLGCTDKTEICNPLIDGGLNCTAIPAHLFTDNLDVLNQQLNLTSQQFSILKRFSDPLTNSIDTSFAENGDGGLLAGDLTDNYISAGLPDNQWILELQNWFVIFLTMVQIRVSDYVGGFDNPQFNRYIVAPTPDEQWMCSNQVAQRDDYASFSVLGLVIIFCLGHAIMILNLLLGRVNFVWLKRMKGNEYRAAQWKAMELLELQRAACTSGLEPHENHKSDSDSRLSSPSTAESRHMSHVEDVNKEGQSKEVPRVASSVDTADLESQYDLLAPRLVHLILRS